MKNISKEELERTRAIKEIGRGSFNEKVFLEDMGASDEIFDALNIISFEDEKGATRLLNRVVQHGVKFSGENLAEIVNLCAEDSFKKMLYQSTDK